MKHLTNFYRLQIKNKGKRMLKKLILTIGLIFISIHSNAIQKVPTHFIATPNLDQIKKEDLFREKRGQLYRVGIATSVHLTTINSGCWSKNNNKATWELIIENPGAKALSFIFKRFKLSTDATFWIENMKGEKVSNTYSDKDTLDELQQNIALCMGDKLLLKLEETIKNTPSEIEIERVIYNYRLKINSSVEKINESQNCEVNVNCSEGKEYQDEKKGVAVVYVIDQLFAGFCSGSLVNNTAQNCKPLMLTAFHCGISTSDFDLNLWQFYFNYESPNCSNPISEGNLKSNFITGCKRLAGAEDGGAITGSDFLLLQIGSILNEETTIEKLKSANFNVYWNGWDVNNIPPISGVGIHHPEGDIKKISTYTTAPISSNYGETASNTHWKLFWVETENGHGVTEGGSSGSPLFTYNNGNSRIVGTLTGGTSCCISGGCSIDSSSVNSQDVYGKLSYHWESNGDTPNKKLSPFLDPLKTNVKILDGSYNPCSISNLTPINTINNFKIYPNPTTDNLTLTFETNQKKNVTVNVFDFSGKLMFNSNFISDENFEIDLSKASKGLYFIEIAYDNILVTEKISKL